MRASRVYPLLVAYACVLVLWLVLAEKPWQVHVTQLIEEGGKVPLEAFVADGLWWGALANLLAVLVLLATARWWSMPMPAAEYPRSGTSGRACKAGGVPMRRGVFLAILSCIAVLALVERLPRMGLSLWNDEEYTLRRYVLGYEKLLPDGTLKPDFVSWEETFFFNRGANNHIPFSAAAKLSLSAWRTMGGGRAEAGQPQPFFSEAALRLPALLAGVGSILVVGMLVARWCSPVAGLASAALLALHPWHIRYSTEARGYAFLLLFAALALWFASRAIGRGRWRDWLGYGCCQFLYLWSFPGAIYLAAAMNALLLPALALQRPRWRRGLVQVARLGVANVLSACAFLLAMGPSIRQIRLYLARDIAQGEMGPDWWLDIGSHLLVGTRYAMDDPGFPQYLSIQHVPGLEGGGAVVLMLVLAALCLAGILRAARLGAAPLLCTLAPLAAAALAYAHTAATGNFLFSWYLLYTLLGLSPALFLGFEALTGLLPAKPVTKALAALAASTVFLATYFAATASITATLQTVPRQPLSESIAAARACAPNAIVAATGVSSRQFASYCPGLKPVDEGDEQANLILLDKLMAEARQQGRPLVVLFSGGPLRRAQNSALYARLANSGLFSRKAVLTGHEDFFDVEVFLMVSVPAPRS